MQNGDSVAVTPNVCVYDIYGSLIACKTTGALAPGENFGRDLLTGSVRPCSPPDPTQGTCCGRCSQSFRAAEDRRGRVPVHRPGRDRPLCDAEETGPTATVMERTPYVMR